MASRKYSSTAASKTLSAITTDTLTVSPDISTLPQVYPYTLVIDPDTASEEIVTVRSLNSGAVLNITRGQDGTGSTGHDVGAVIKHMITPRDLQEPQNHIEASGAYTVNNDGFDPTDTDLTITKSLHGIAVDEGSVVGTAKEQTLSNKTLTSPIISSPTISSPTISGTITGAVVTSANIVDGTIVNADINASAAIAQSKIANLTTDLGAKAPIANPTFTGTVSGVTKSMVGLSNVDNTSDANKPISSATQTALNGKISSSSGTAGDLTVTGVLRVPGSVGLYFGNDDYIEYNDTDNTFYFTRDTNFYANLQAHTVSAENDLFAADAVYNYWVEFNDNDAGIGYCRPQDDNDTQCGSTTRRWTRVYAVNTSISSSDERDKFDVADSPLGLDFINDLRPVAYRWQVGEKTAVLDEDGKPVLDADGNKQYETREGLRKHYGLIAQEVKQALDNSGVDDFAGWVQDDMSDPDSHQSLSYEQFIAPLIKSVQELSAEVQILKAKVAELEAN
jgi:hypothetical protein